MTVGSLLIPKGWALAVWGVSGILAVVQFSNTITVGSIVIAAAVVVLAGVFTLRNNVRSFWRGLAEERAEKITSLEQVVKERETQVRILQEQSRAEMASYAEEQRIVRHELKNQLAAAMATLQVEQAKTDLSALLELLAKQHSEAMAGIAEGLGKQDELIRVLVSDRHTPDRGGTP